MNGTSVGTLSGTAEDVDDWRVWDIGDDGSCGSLDMSASWLEAQCRVWSFTEVTYTWRLEGEEGDDGLCGKNLLSSGELG